jgi:hypothetical protein
VREVEVKAEVEVGSGMDSFSTLASISTCPVPLAFPLASSSVCRAVPRGCFSTLTLTLTSDCRESPGTMDEGRCGETKERET